jgi:hypothetical protein
LNLAVNQKLKYNTMKKLLILLSLLSAISCDKVDDKNFDTELIGKWGLKEVLADPGDGSGTFHAVESNKIIEFHSDGTITSNGTICDMSIESNNSTSGTYSITDSTISSIDCNNQMKIRFEKTGSSLVINYPCIEPCRAKYVKK